ncbi:MAG TPA: LapA family protein [Syntrophorhabdales bacterium]|nr:LapA family protein [Syntrophorhabdales bacterium]
MFILIFAVLIVAAAVIFSYQNSAVVTLSFVIWNFTASLAIVVFLAVLAGMVIMGLLWSFTSLKKSMKKGTKSREVAAGAGKSGNLP